MTNYIKSKKGTRSGCLVFLTIVIIMVCIIILAAVSPLFNIRHIIVKGNNHYRADRIIEASGLQIGMGGLKKLGKDLYHILEMRLGENEQNITKNLPYIKSVTVKLVIPDAVEIIVTERVPLCKTLYKGSTLVLDYEFNVLELSETDSFSLPEIKGMEIMGFELGQALKFYGNNRYNELIKLILAIEESDKNSTIKLMAKTNHFEIKGGELSMLIDSRIIVYFSDALDIDYNVRVLKQIFFKSIGEKEKGIIDFTIGEHPVFLPEE